MPNPPRTTEQACLAHDQCPVGLACAPSRAALCEGMNERHAAKLAICEVLEAIADSLPGAVQRHECLKVAEALLPAVRDAQSFEEIAVFPAYAQSLGQAASLQRLRAEHIVDESLAEELTEKLLQIGHGGAVENPEAFGFMLRTFFESMRRHIAFEREHVVPMMRETEEDPARSL